MVTWNENPYGWSAEVNARRVSVTFLADSPDWRVYSEDNPRTLDETRPTPEEAKAVGESWLYPDKRIAELEAQLAAATERAERAEAALPKKWADLYELPILGMELRELESLEDENEKRALAAEKALRLECGRPEEGDLPEGWYGDGIQGYNSPCDTFRVSLDDYPGMWKREKWNEEARSMTTDEVAEHNTAAEAIEAAQRAMKGE